MSCHRGPCAAQARRLLATLGFGLVCLPDPTSAATPAPRLTLGQALATAFRQHPSLAVTEADVAIAQADVEGARVYPHNPQLGATVGLRRAGDESTLDAGISLSQTAEVGAKRERRMAVAELSLKAQRSAAGAAALALSARVRRAFGVAVRARDEALLATRREGLAAKLLGLAEKRLKAGSGTRLDLNLARAEAGRAARGHQEATASSLGANADLAAAAGLDPTAPPEPEGVLPDVAPPSASAGELAAQAGARRPDLVAARRSVEAAEAAVGLAEANAAPDPVLQASLEREGSEALIIGAGLSIALPLFFRNEGEVARARAALRRARADVASLELDLRRGIAGAHARLTGAVAGRLRLEALVIGSLEEGLGLLDRSLEAGEIGIAQVVIFQQHLLEAHGALIAARSDAWGALVELDRVTGAPLGPTAASEGGIR